MNKIVAAQCSHDVFPLSIRAGNHWWVSDKVGKMGGGLRAEVGKVDQLMPPVQGWMFWNERKWSDKDYTLQCRRQPSVACKDITVESGGKAKKKHPDCAGRYRSIKGTYIRGREVRSKSVTKI